MEKRTRERDQCGIRDRVRIDQTDTDQDRDRQRLLGPQDFHAQFLTTNSVTL